MRSSAIRAPGLLAATSRGWLLLLLLPWFGPQAASAQPKRPDPPRSPVIHHQPDTQGCRPESIEAGYRQQLQPFADQSEAVLAQLRQLQRELTTGSIQRCRAKELLSAEEATALERRLGLTPAPPLEATPSASPQPAQPQRP